MDNEGFSSASPTLWRSFDEKYIRQLLETLCTKQENQFLLECKCRQADASHRGDHYGLLFEVIQLLYRNKVQKGKLG